MQEKDNKRIQEINKAVTALEAKLGEKYRDLGEKFYEKNAAEPVAEFAEEFDDIKDIAAEIKNFRIELNEINGIYECSKCGARMAEASSFCAECGARIEKSKKILPEGMVECENCGHLLGEGVKFCICCGYKMIKDEEEVAEEAAPAEEVVEAAVEEAAPAEEDNVLKCKNCGAELEPEDKFCIQCGAAVNFQSED